LKKKTGNFNRRLARLEKNIGFLFFDSEKPLFPKKKKAEFFKILRPKIRRIQ